MGFRFKILIGFCCPANYPLRPSLDSLMNTLYPIYFQRSLCFSATKDIDLVGATLSENKTLYGCPVSLMGSVLVVGYRFSKLNGFIRPINNALKPPFPLIA